MKVCVQGLWHLGSVTAACLASLGHDVVRLDFSTTAVNSLNQGDPPLFEPGLEHLLKQGLDAKRLTFTSDPEAVSGIDVLWITHDTPVDENDNADVDFVVAEIEKTLPRLAVGTTVLISSQMPVGSVRRLETIAATQLPGKRLGFACSPENLRLGKALDAFLKPDRVVVGLRHTRDRERIKQLFHPITERIE